MATERTFSILKPDVTRRNLTGAVNAKIEAAGLRIVAQRRIHMGRAEAEQFYAVHKERPFFGELVEMMTSAPVVVQVLEGDNAILKYREVMGATNPEKADPGTIRKGLRAVDGREFGARIGCARDRQAGDRAVLHQGPARRVDTRLSFLGTGKVSPIHPVRSGPVRPAKRHPPRAGEGKPRLGRVHPQA